LFFDGGTGENVEKEVEKEKNVDGLGNRAFF